MPSLLNAKTQWYGRLLALAVPLLAVFFVFLLAPSQAQVSYQILHTFGAGADGESIWSGVAFDSRGNLFGTTEAGGSSGIGTAYELTPSRNGQWTETILHDFGTAGDGAEPWGELLVRSDALYGTTSAGGTSGYGTLFALGHDPSGWTEEVL